MQAAVFREAWPVNPALRQAVLSLQRRSEESEELRKAAENILRSAQKEAEKSVRDSARVAALETTATLFAHEVANSLNGVFASLQLLDMNAREENSPDPELKSLLGSATQEIKRLGSLLQDFRSFVRPQKYYFEAIDLARLIEEAIKTEKLLYDSMGIQVKFEFPDALSPVRVDEDKIKQAILSICKNAVEAMPSGGVLTLRAYESGGIFLEIADTGAGIPEGLKIFEPFLTTKPLGSGLGLPIVSQIISAHKGTIDYASEAGKGTTFKIGLPAGKV
jgi:two-component system, sporulation sensor kinase E